MIQIENKTLTEIEKEVYSVLERQKARDIELDIEKKDIKKTLHILNNPELASIFERLKDQEHIQNFNYEDLAKAHDRIQEVQKELHQIKEEVELYKFFKNGKIYDWNKLKYLAEARGIKKKFPRFKISKLKELIENPILEIKNYADESIKFDPFVVKKLNIAIIQMIFNEMDLYITNTGIEGAGKSCWSSQLMLYLWTVLTKVGLVEYAYEIHRMFFSSLEAYLDEQEQQKSTDYFRIMTLDEAYELNRQNFREDSNILYKDDMRSARKNQRINQNNLPQIGELDTSITLSRTNFIFDCVMDNEAKTGTLKKGIIDMYILPRGKYIYSPFQKRNLTRNEVKYVLSKQLEKKSNYYLEMPKELLIHKFEFKDVWGFDRDEYLKYIKSQNKEKRLSKGNIKTSEFIAYILFKKLPEVKHWGTFDLKDPQDKKMYNTLKRWEYAVKQRFYENPDKLKRFDIHYSKAK